VRIKVKIKSLTSGRELVVSAVVNTGFVSESADIIVPASLAERLGIWPPHGEALVVALETGGGLIEAYVAPRALAVQVITEDRVSREIVANAIVNPYVEEVLISDYLAEELGIQILYPRRGLWKFEDENKVRESVVES